MATSCFFLCFFFKLKKTTAQHTWHTLPLCLTVSHLLKHTWRTMSKLWLRICTESGFCSVQMWFGVKQLTCFDLFSQKHWVSVPDPRWCHSPVLTRKWTPQSIAWSSSPSWHTHTQTHTRAHNAYIELEVKMGPNLRLNWNNENQTLRFSNVLVFRLGSCFILF